MMTDDILCLLCCSTLSQKETDDNHLLSTNLSVFFILRNLLQVPDAEIQWNLRECGNPGNWISLCDICCQLTRKAEQVHSKILKLQQDLRSTQLKIVEKVILASVDDKQVEHLKTDGKDKEESTKGKAIWRKTRAFIQSYDYSSDGIPHSSPFIEGDKLASQLANQDTPFVPVIKEEVEDDFYGDDENREDLDWGESDKEIENGRHSESDSDWSVTTTAKSTKELNNSGKKKEKNSVTTLRTRKARRKYVKGIEDKWECQYCDKVFTCRGTRNSHQKARHPAIPGQHICHICSRACNSHHLLLMHMRGAHKLTADRSPIPPQTFECRYCDKVFHHRGTRDSHHLAKHPVIPGQHVCGICGAARNSNGFVDAEFGYLICLFLIRFFMKR